MRRILKATSFEFFTHNKVWRRAQTTVITENSWAAERLTTQGEKLEKAAPLPRTHYTSELISSPPENVISLCDQILALNVIESHQLMALLQVQNISRLTS